MTLEDGTKRKKQEGNYANTKGTITVHYQGTPKRATLTLSAQRI